MLCLMFARCSTANEAYQITVYNMINVAILRSSTGNKEKTGVLIEGLLSATNMQQPSIKMIV